MIAVSGLIAGGLLGAIAGSFLTTAALRGGAQGFALVGRSRCDHCGVRLSFAATAPVVSYALLKGRCGHCAGAIAPAHPMGELAGLVTGAMIAALWPPQAWALGGIIAAALLFASVHDARTQRLPDPLTAVVALAAIGLSLQQGRLASGLLTGLVVLVVLAAACWLYARRRNRPGLGLGDVKLIAALAIWCGPGVTPWAVILAAGSALAVRLAARTGPDDRTPFGPYIAAGFWLAGTWSLQP